jgi:hypothetical protein
MTILTTTCPDLGAWRAWLDRAKRMPGLDAHLEACTTCQEHVAHLRDNAHVAGDALRTLGAARPPSTADVALARERLAWRQRQTAAVAPPQLLAPENLLVLVSRISTPWRVAASGVAAAFLVMLIVAFTPEGRTAAAGFLAQFRSQQVTAIEVSPQSQTEITRTLRALGNLGTFRTPSGAAASGNALPRIDEPKSVSLAEASQQLGFALQTPDPTTLPAGVDRTPRVQVIPANEIRFTFDKAKASGYFRSTGHADVTLPDKFDGAALVVSIPAAALLEYGGGNTHQALVIGQSGELVVDVQGKVSLDELRDFLLGLPGLPRETTDQLRQIRNWNQTLPVPIPTDKMNWKSESFKGNQGLLLNDNTGVGSAALWQAGGHLYGVAGSLKATELKRVADSLAVR